MIETDAELEAQFQELRKTTLAAYLETVAQSLEEVGREIVRAWRIEEALAWIDRRLP